MLDIKIINGQVLDGTGTPAQRTDVGINGDHIAAMGNLSDVEAKTVINAAGGYVCPGFIDVHSHSDAYLLIEPSAPSKIYQGVTTEVVGQCGASAAPRLGAARMPSDWASKEYPGTWSTVAEYRSLLEQVEPAVNVVLLIGHNTLRGGAMGYEARTANADDLKRMATTLEQAMDEGGAGFTTGLIYPPGVFASADEVVALAKVTAKHDGIYASHMRSEGRHLLEAIEETLSVGRSANIRVQVSHLKTSGKNNWHLIDDALALIHKAQDEGIEVASDRYPYTASCTDLDIILPDWASEGSRDEILKRLRTPATRQKIRSEIVGERDADYWTRVAIGTTTHPDNAGRRVTEIAETWQCEPIDAVLRLIDEDELATGGIFFGMSEANMWRILAEPYVMMGSDASIRSPEGPLSTDHPHPRAYGSFPRFLRASLDGRTVGLAEAVRKMTSLPAEHFRLKDRGLLAQGKAADVVVFDPEQLKDLSTYEKPHQLAEGVNCVIVNGVVTMEQGTPTGDRGGVFLG